MSLLKQLKKLQGSNKTLVYGYIREIERSIVEKSNITAIPLLIFYNILGYFYMNEYFSECGDDLEISNNNMTVKKNSSCGWENGACFNFWFNSKGNEIATWRFRIDKIRCDGIFCADHNHEIYFAFISRDMDLNDCICGDKDGRPSYGFSSYNYYRYFGEFAEVGSNFFPTEPGDGDIISIELNTQKGRIRCNCNYKSSGDDTGEYNNVYRGIEQKDDIKYKLAISMHTIYTAITLIDFKCFNIV